MKKIKSLMGILMSLIMTISIFSVPALAANPALIDETKEVTVNIHKYDVTEAQLEALKQAGVHDTGEELTVPPTYNGLAGVKFSYFQVGKIGETEKFIKETGSTLNGVTEKFALDSNGLPITGSYVETGETAATDSSGNTTFKVNSDGTGAQIGLYYVVETQAPEKVTTKTDPFFVYLPMTVVNKNAWNYNVHLYPKNATTLGAVLLTKQLDNGTKALPANVIAAFKLQYRAIDAVDPATWTDMTDSGGQTIIYKTQNGGANHGKLAVNDLLVNQYRFVETGVYDVDPDTKAETLSTTIGTNNTPITFDIVKGATGYVDPVTFITTGTVSDVIAKDYTLPDPEKDIQIDASTTAKHNGYSVGDTVEWVVSSNIPLDINHYTKFIVTDPIDDRLTYTGADDVVVKAGSTVLEKDTHYKLDFDTDTKTLKVTIIDPTDPTFTDGRDALYGAVTTSATAKVTVAFKTTVNSNGISAVIPNQAKLDFNNSYGTDTDKDTDIPEIHYNGVKFIKQSADSATTVLDGAEFALYATRADAAAGTNPIRTATSADGGKFQFVGLAYGAVDVAYDDPAARTTYYMVETKAPAGYQLVNTIFDVEVYYDSITVTTANPIIVKNNPDTVLPITGGIGTVIFTVLGIAFIAGACILLVRVRKNKSER